jgi:hypothetical protein
VNLRRLPSSSFTAFVRIAVAVSLISGGVMSSTAHAARIAGVDFAESSAVGGHALPLRGLASLRLARWIEVSVAAFYVEPGVGSDAVLGDVPRRLEIEYLRGFRAIDFTRSTRFFVRRNVGDERYRALEPHIERWNDFYRDVAPGDRYTLTYTPGSGTELALNGVVLGSLPGSQLSEAIFSIWLGDRPLDAGFRSDLLSLPRDA